MMRCHMSSLRQNEGVTGRLRLFYLLQQKRARVSGGEVSKLNGEHRRPLLHPETHKELNMNLQSPTSASPVVVVGMETQ